jgi:TolB-like protein
MPDRDTKTKPKSRVSGRIVVIAMLGLAAILAVVASIGRPTVRLRPGRPEQRPAIAVVPFESLSGRPELALLSAEVTEAVHERLSAALSEEGPFEVRPREDGTTFRGLDGGVEAIARALRASYILTGSASESPDAIEVDVYVVFVERETRVWAERFIWPKSEESMREIPEAVAARVAEALQGVR